MNPTKPTDKKKAMLEALEKALGVITQACKSVGIHRSTHYDWMQTDDGYRAAVDDIQEVAVDFAESHLHKLIKDGNPAATIFFLKTKGKGRGYVERQEIAVAEKKPLSWFTDDSADVS
jgi:hypothetical protein